MFVGITGGIGSGKSYICEKFRAMGIPVYNADDRAKFLMENNPELIVKLKENFGEEIYIHEKLNRKALANKVFNNTEALALLNSLVHPAVEKDVANWAEINKNQKYLIKEAALLFETGSYKNLDKTILVHAPEEERILRVMKRDKSTKEQVLARIQNQLSDLEKMEHADFIINNNGKNEIDKIVMKLNMLFSSGIY